MNLIGKKYEWTTKVSVFIVGYYFVWQLLSIFIQACVMWQLAGQWLFLFQLVTGLGPNILVQCFAINTMFLLTILKENVGNGFLHITGTPGHDCGIWNSTSWTLSFTSSVWGFSVYTLSFNMPYKQNLHGFTCDKWRGHNPVYYLACPASKFPLQRFKSGEHKGHNLYPPSLLLLFFHET